MIGDIPQTADAFDGIPDAVYHEVKALSSSGAWTLIDECPRLYWADSPLNPLREREAKRDFEIGNALHLLVLQPGELDRIVVPIDAENYRTKEARDERDAVRTAGRIPLLPHEFEMVREMRDALWSHPVAKHAFVDGAAERSFFWQDEATGVWCKARPDFTPIHGRYLPDLKSAASANPEAFERSVADFGYYMRSAFYLEGMKAITGEAPEKVCYVVIRKKKPHLVSVCWLDDEALEWGKLRVREAIDVFARCLDAGEWPQYRRKESPDKDTAFEIRLPLWTRKDLEERHERGEFESKYERLVATGAAPAFI